jgi:hypothetical protein
MSSESIDLGHNVDAGSTTSADDANASADGAVPGEPVATPLISASISAAMGTICAGACVDLLATASGGTGPYDYAWGQGLGEGRGPKAVCPVATTTYSVMVSSLSSEQQSTASAMVTVVSCDAGSAPSAHDAGGAPQETDSGGGQTAAMCVPDPSFEGQPTIGMSGAPGTPATGAPPQWQVCQGDPDIDPSVSLLPAANGNTYAGLAVGTGSLAYMTASIGTTLCASLVPGTRYSFCMDLAIGVRGVMAPLTTDAPPPALEIWGGTTPCNQDALLWTSPPITNTDSWTNVCGAFVASQALSTITLLPAEGSASVGPGTWSYVIVDDITAGP